MNPIEKILWGLFILMSLGALGWGIVSGLPSTYPASAMHSEKIPEQQWRAQLTIEQRTELDQMLSVASRRRVSTASNKVRDTNTAVNTLATSPKNRVVANPWIGPEPN